MAKDRWTKEDWIARCGYATQLLALVAGKHEHECRRAARCSECCDGACREIMNLVDDFLRPPRHRRHGLPEHLIAEVRRLQVDRAERMP